MLCYLSVTGCNRHERLLINASTCAFPTVMWNVAAVCIRLLTASEQFERHRLHFGCAMNVDTTKGGVPGATPGTPPHRAGHSA